MGEGDYMPAGYRPKKPVSQQRLKELRKLWEKSEEIHALSQKHHHEHEVPAAEEELQKALEAMENNSKK